MLNYYVEQNGKIINVNSDKQLLLNTYGEKTTIQETERPLVLSDDCSEYLFADTPEYEAQQVAVEKARIQELKITRSDFFDAMIKAFGTNDKELLNAFQPILQSIASGEQVIEGLSNEIAIKIAVNNYENAGDFYRKHTLFTLLSNIPIKLREELTVTITPEQWDKFFDEADKKNPDAYKVLLPSI